MSGFIYGGGRGQTIAINLPRLRVLFSELNVQVPDVNASLSSRFSPHMRSRRRTPVHAMYNPRFRVPGVGPRE